MKAFILAGQSKLEGAGHIKANRQRNEGKGSLEFIARDPTTAHRFKHTRD